MREIARDAAIDGIIETVRVAVTEATPSGSAGWVMPVSGGRGSRHLLLELIRQGHVPAACVTARQYPLLWGGRDARFAARLCGRLGLPLRTLALPGSLVAAEWRKNRLTSYCSSEHVWALPVAHAIRSDAGHTFDGRR